MTISVAGFILIASILLALLEIQIEGKNGWASKLPTWKVHNPFKKIVNWPYITGYHLFLNCFIFFVLQFPFFLGAAFTLKNEITVLEVTFLILITEDLMWFVFNPAWGIKKFFSETIPWHGRKILFLPRNYWVAFMLVAVLEIIRNSL